MDMHDERYEKLFTWLMDNNANLVYSFDYKDYDHFRFLIYLVNGHVCIIQTMGEGGWVMYSKTCDKNNIHETLEEAEKQFNL